MTELQLTPEEFENYSLHSDARRLTYSESHTKLEFRGLILSVDPIAWDIYVLEKMKISVSLETQERINLRIQQLRDQF